LRTARDGRAILVLALVTISFLSGIFAGIGLNQSSFEQVPVASEVCFSPGNNCAAIVIQWINQAKTSIHVLMFTFTLQSIANVLIEAKNRGLDVRVVLERNQGANQPVQARLVEAGIEVRLDNNDALMHHKVAIIDSTIVVTGSFNWTESANTSNNENLVVIRDFDLVRMYESQFQVLWNESTR